MRSFCGSEDMLVCLAWRWQFLIVLSIWKEWRWEVQCRCCKISRNNRGVVEQYFVRRRLCHWNAIIRHVKECQHVEHGAYCQDSIDGVLAWKDPCRRPSEPRVRCKLSSSAESTDSRFTSLRETKATHFHKRHFSRITIPNTRPRQHINATMDQAKELLEMPREFVKDGRQFLTRCSKRTSPDCMNRAYSGADIFNAY